METLDFLSFTRSVQQRFEEARSILSFGEYLTEVAKDPARHSRNSAQYIQDAFRFFGTRTVETPYGKETRFRKCST